MAMMKMARFLVDFRATDTAGNSHVRFAAGQAYPLEDADGETKRCIARGVAEEVDVDVPNEPAAETQAVEGETKLAEAETPAADAKPAKGKK